MFASLLGTALGALSCSDMKAAYKSQTCCPSQVFDPNAYVQGQACSCGGPAKEVTHDADTIIMYHYTDMTSSDFEAYKTWSLENSFNIRKMVPRTCSYKSKDSTQLLSIVKVPYAIVADKDYVQKTLALGNPVVSKLVNIWSLATEKFRNDPAIQENQQSINAVVSSLGVNNEQFTTLVDAEGESGWNGKGQVTVIIGHTDEGDGFKKYDDKLINTYFNSQKFLSGVQNTTGMFVSFASKAASASEDRKKYRDDVLLYEIFANYPETISKPFTILSMNAADTIPNPLNNPLIEFSTITDLPCSL